MAKSNFPTREKIIDMLVNVGGIRERLEAADNETIETLYLDIFVKLKI